jgi:hypothetical protein
MKKILLALLAATLLSVVSPCYSARSLKSSMSSDTISTKSGMSSDTINQSSDSISQSSDSISPKSNSSTKNSSSSASPKSSVSPKKSSSSSGSVNVKGYTRKDGTYVKPHTRKAPKRK